MVCNTDGLDMELGDKVTELNIIAEQMQTAIAENSRTAIDQNEYERRYADLTERYNTIKSGFNLSRFYFKSVLKDESYIVLAIYHHFLHKAAPKSLIEFFYQSPLLFQRPDESLE